MKVLVIHSELGVLRGGGENFTRNIFTAFAERGHAVSAVFTADSKGRYPIALPHKIQPIALAGYWSRKLGQEALSDVARWMPKRMQIRSRWERLQEAICWRTVRWHDRRFARRIKREFGSHWEEYDAVYVHGNSFLASSIAQHRPTVLRLPGPLPADLAPVLKGIHAICANGDALTHLRMFLGDRAIELPVGLDSHNFRPGSTQGRERLGWTKDHWVIGYVGRLAYVKGVDLLAQAFRQIQQSMSHARLLIIGSGEEEKKLRAVLDQELRNGIAHIESDVPHDLLPGWYRGMDLFVMPSRYENFSNALLEALMCGVPFLVSDIGGNRHLLAETQGGWCFSVGSADSLAEMMDKIGRESSMASDRGAFGSKKVSSSYSWEVSAKRLEDIFQSCLDREAQLHAVGRIR